MKNNALSRQISDFGIQLTTETEREQKEMRIPKLTLLNKEFPHSKLCIRSLLKNTVSCLRRKKVVALFVAQKIQAKVKRICVLITVIKPRKLEVYFVIHAIGP